MAAEIIRVEVVLSLQNEKWNLFVLELLELWFQATDRLQGFRNAETRPGLRLLQLAAPVPAVERGEVEDSSAERIRRECDAIVLHGTRLKPGARDEVLRQAIQECPDGVAVTQWTRAQDLLLTNLDPAPERHSWVAASGLSVRQGSTDYQLSLMFALTPDAFASRSGRRLFMEWDFARSPAESRTLRPILDLLGIDVCGSSRGRSSWFRRRNGVAIKVIATST